MGFPEAKWAVDQVVSKVGVQPNNMRKFEAVALNETTIGLKFLEPEDSYYSIGGALAAVTKGVRIMRSETDYPQSINDGTLVIENKELGKYSDKYLNVTGLTKGKKYYFTAFPFSNVGVYNESLNAANKANAIPNNKEKVNVTVNIDNTKRFERTIVTLKNISTSEVQTKNVTYTQKVIFEVKESNEYVVTVSAVSGYFADKLISEKFTAVVNGERNIEFNFKMGFIYTIKYDNGGDGIPSSFEYLDDCEGFTPALGSEMNSWAGTKILDKFKPCVIKPNAKAPEYYLEKDNYNKRAGSAVPAVLTGADGDVMIEVQKMYYKVTHNPDKTVTLSISEFKTDGYKCLTESAGKELDCVYRAAYEASVLDGALRSVSGAKPATNETRDAFRKKAKARGVEYSQNDFYILFIWQCMYILLYGSRDSQSVIGRGRVERGASSSALTTGAINGKSFCWGDQTGENGVKFLGVEHFYGDVWEFVDGITVVDFICKITKDPVKYDDTGVNYEITTSKIPENARSLYITSMQKENDEALFIPATASGSETTYYCDALLSKQELTTATVAFGGYWDDRGKSGAFCWLFDGTVGTVYGNVGSRLCRKKVS